jgi:hypothetical protein
MGRFVSLAALGCILLSCAFLASCGHSQTTNVVVNPVPTSVSLTSSSAVGLNVSLEVGKTLGFTATARNPSNQVINETFSFLSSNPAVVTIAGNGAACAGTWDSLTNPQVCTPGTVGTGQLTATAQNVSSAPITVYVHARITSIAVSKVPVQAPTLSNVCLSKGAPAGPESWLYQATAMNGSNDITSSVGPFSWQGVSPTGSSAIVNLTSTPATTPALNEEIVSAGVPGLGMIFASASGLNSQTVPVETCPVQTISIAAAGNPATSLLVNAGTSTTLNATVTDILGITLTGVPLTWSTSNPISTTASGSSSTVFGSLGIATAAAVGAANVTASCTPPTCNGGIKPSLPIYPASPISFTVRGTSTPASPTVYVSTTACTTANPTNAICNATIVPITKSSTTSAFSAGSPVALPASPNSILFDPKGTNAYLGVASTHFGQNGAMVFSGSAASQFTSAFGTVLAASPDTTSVIFSDTVDTPNQIFVCNNCSTTSRTITSVLIPGATAAAFSPDSVKAYIVAGSNLYIYSKVDALQKISLTAQAFDAAFIGNGMFGYLAGGDAAGAASFPVCFDPNSGAALGSVATAPGAMMMRALPDGNSILALAPPDVETITASIGGSPSLNVPGCPAPRGFYTLANSVSPALNLGQGAFIPTQLMISEDGSTAYILGKTPPPNTAPLPFVITFNIGNQTTSLISLSGTAVPLSASISPAGDFLFVGADDGTVHVVDTASGADLQQISFPIGQSPLCFGPGNPPTVVPKTVLGISAVSQNGSNATYSYVVNSGPALAIGETVVIAGMQDGGNDGTYTILSLGAGTFTVTNNSGVTTTSAQNGSGTVPITCNPDLVAVKP